MRREILSLPRLGHLAAQDAEKCSRGGGSYQLQETWEVTLRVS